ncbi:hypothetical protein CRENPOLYSF2_80004 [Crenothrix polyspora]|uniref:Uncharacterized protein n=1 Tax=Crenothrix polyspora TaxID=360316 RepID=A0A1R4HJ64_9GAMM|nr:hypothetical protein [Crenothrix polyspora]SJM95920.1 hypothetical protein CRENPOLYSF2_80004 [Crenothrix polyspora]
MIEIHIDNIEELAEIQQSGFMLFISKLFGLDIQKKVEIGIANRLQEDLARQGVKTEVTVK